MALGTANGATAVATSEATDVTAGESAVTADGAADGTVETHTGMEVDTDPVPTMTAPPTAEHISSFLLYIRRRAADDATATAASAAEALATPPLPWCERGYYRRRHGACRFRRRRFF